jgi:hypothetical protein
MKAMRALRPDFKFDKNDKYKVKFVRMVSGVPNVVAQRRVKRMQSVVSAQNSTFTIDFNAPAFRQGNTFWYFFDTEKGQLSISSSSVAVDASLNNMVLKRQGIRQLVMATEKRKLADIIVYIILAIAVGIMGGFLLHMGITAGF